MAESVNPSKEHPIIMSTEMVKAILGGKKAQTRRTNGLKEINKKPNMWKVYCYQNEYGLWAWFSTKDNSMPYEQKIIRCPYGQMGNSLWVRETWTQFPDGKTVTYKADDKYYFSVWKSSIFMPRWASRITLEITGIRVERVQEITNEDAELEGINPYTVDKLKGGSFPNGKTLYCMLKTYHHEVYPIVSHADEGEIVTFDCPNMGFARMHHTKWQEGQDPVFRIPIKEVFEYVGSAEPNFINSFRITWDSINAKRKVSWNTDMGTISGRGYSWESNPWVWVIEFKRIGNG